MSFQNILELPKHTSQLDMPDPTGCSDSENVYNTIEGNSGDEGMDDDLGEPDYMNVTPGGSASGSGGFEDSRKTKKTSPVLDTAPDPNMGAMAAVWNVAAGLRLWGDTARYNQEKKRKIDLGSFTELARSLEKVCASMEVREAYQVGRLAESGNQECRC